MRATITGMFPVTPGATPVSGWVEFAFDATWSDGLVRVSSPVRGILHPTLFNSFVTPGTLQPLLVPATAYGSNVSAGPPITVTWYLLDSAGQPNSDGFFAGILQADASGNWNVNTKIVDTIVSGTGPAPTGLYLGDIGTLVQSPATLPNDVGAFAVRYDAAQTLTLAQRNQARKNAGPSNNFKLDAASYMAPGYSRSIPLPDTGFSTRVLCKDLSVANRVWFQGSRFGQIGFSDNAGTTFTPKYANPGGAQAIQGMTFVNGFAYLLCSTGSTQGQLWRAPLPDASGNGMTFTKIFDLAAPPGGITPGANSSFRNACVAVLAGSPNQLYLLEYGTGQITGGPQLYYSADNGTTWLSRRQWANAKHGHAVQVVAGVPWVMLGDGGAGLVDVGLWKASTAAATVWNQVSNFGADYTNIVGINFFAITPPGATTQIMLFESDGLQNFGPLIYPATSGSQKPLMPSSTLPAQYAGTMRSMCYTSEGYLMWAHTGEGGAVGPYDSFWIAAPPFNQPILLESASGAGNPLGTLGDAVEDGIYVWMGFTRIVKPTLIT